MVDVPPIDAASSAPRASGGLPGLWRQVWADARTRMLVVAACGVLATAFFSRYEILSGFRLIDGDRYDRVMSVSNEEHWYDVFRGYEHWSETGYYYPEKSTLGYNDGVFLYGVGYSIFRALGADSLAAAAMFSMALRLIGFFGFYAAARRILRLQPSWAVLGAVVFTICNNAFVNAGHDQILTVCLVPVMALLIDSAGHALLEGRRDRLLASGLSAAALYSGWLLSTFYMAWFTAFFGAFFLAAFLWLSDGAMRRRLWQAVRREAWPIADVAAVFAALSTPFLLVYVPKALETGMHSYEEALAFMASPPDVVHVGAGNLLFGGLDTWLNGLLRPGLPPWTEGMSGFPPLVLALFGAGAFMLLAGRRREARDDRRIVLQALALATLTTWALTIEVGDHSLWRGVFTVFPGAKGIRVIARYQIFLAVPVVGLATLFLSRLASRISAPLTLALCAFLVAEEVNVRPPYMFDRTAELRHWAEVKPPPPGCAAFFASRARPGSLYPASDGFYIHNADAMMIAHLIHLPTINGAATFWPSGYDLFDPAQRSYLDRVRRYASAQGVDRLCALDLTTMQWSPFPVDGS